MKDEPLKIYIGHCLRDTIFAQRLHESLRSNGFDVFGLSPVDLGEGSASQLKRSVEESDIYVPLLTSNSFESRELKSEIITSLELCAMPGRGGRPRIIPVLSKDCKTPPFQFLRQLDPIDCDVMAPLACFQSLSDRVKSLLINQQLPLIEKLYAEGQSARILGRFKEAARTFKRVVDIDQSFRDAALQLEEAESVLKTEKPKSNHLIPNGLLMTAVAVSVTVVVFGCIVFLLFGRSKPESVALATNTPIPSPTIRIESSPTVAPANTQAPPTRTITATSLPTRTLPKSVAPKKPAIQLTPTPSSTSTPSLPPEVYVKSMETVPSKVNIDDIVGFRMTVFNNTGTMQPRRKWFVLVYQCPEQCQSFPNSYGQSLKLDVNIQPGLTEITTPQQVHIGKGRCDYIAIPYYTGESDATEPFHDINNQTPFYLPFSACH